MASSGNTHGEDAVLSDGGSPSSLGFGSPEGCGTLHTKYYGLGELCAGA